MKVCWCKRGISKYKSVGWNLQISLQGKEGMEIAEQFGGHSSYPMGYSEEFRQSLDHRSASTHAACLLLHLNPALSCLTLAADPEHLGWSRRPYSPMRVPRHQPPWNNPNRHDRHDRHGGVPDRTRQGCGQCRWERQYDFSRWKCLRPSFWVEIPFMWTTVTLS